MLRDLAFSIPLPLWRFDCDLLNLNGNGRLDVARIIYGSESRVIRVSHDLPRNRVNLESR